MFDALNISASALQAQRTRMDTIANNMANADTAGNAAAPPFRRRFVVFQPGQQENPDQAGVHVQSIDQDKADFRKVYEPGSKLADKDGFVLYPNIEPTIEMVNMMTATRAYEANITMMESVKSMITSSLRLLA